CKNGDGAQDRNVGWTEDAKVCLHGWITFRANQRTTNMTIPQGRQLHGDRPVAVINVAVSPLSVCSNYRAPRNSFHGVATSVSVVECPWLRMIIAAFSISLGSSASTISTTSKRPNVAKLCFQVTPLQSFLILEDTASASFLKSLGSANASGENRLRIT